MVHLIVAGLGRVGQTLVREVLSTPLRERYRLIGMFEVSGGLVDQAGLPEAVIWRALEWKDRIRDVEGAEKVESLNAYLRSETQFPSPCVLLDMTAAEEMAEGIILALERGLACVASNKKPLVAPWPIYCRLRHPRFRFETTVGAGLPVIATLESLLDSGDEIRSIRGVLSGTLGYLMSQLEDGVPYSQAVRMAYERGYTEPHPAEDLLGMDVARKALILARTMGLRLELEDVQVEGLCPTEWASMPVDEFLEELRRLDGEFQHRTAVALAQGRVLRYIAEVTPEGCRVGLAEVERESALGKGRGPDNVIVFETRRYQERPLVIQGPGAGPLVTAGGILADVAQVSTRE
ncbi:MAG: homoserine dehydrogenase [Anaerolineae bacterium]|nr:homoserine dehydrogenase [Anaerolineae bacterium]MDW8067365.1 homoserine dehydrogenase [Anaerolineae bacterium]